VSYRTLIKVFGLLSLLFVGLNSGLLAQSGKVADWLTDGGDIERTAWQRNETLLTTAHFRSLQEAVKLSEVLTAVDKDFSPPRSLS
jgi:hypothetical protein